jgi:hypothetical protein
MNDTQYDDIFQAFTVALLQQTEPLPATVQSECNKIDETLTIIDIERLAELHPPLLAAYEKAHGWLVTHSGQLRKGPLPNPKFENNNSANTETPNIASDNRDLIDFSEILNLIDKKAQPRGLKAVLRNILQAVDSVQASRDTILLSIADGLVHE